MFVIEHVSFHKIEIKYTCNGRHNINNRNTCRPIPPFVDQ